MCKCQGEDVNLLSLHCAIARELWSMFFSLSGVYWVMPALVLEMLDCWRGQFGSRSFAIIWRAAPLCLMWQIWRNAMLTVLMT